MRLTERCSFLYSTYLRVWTTIVKQKQRKVTDFGMFEKSANAHVLAERFSGLPSFHENVKKERKKSLAYRNLTDCISSFAEVAALVRSHMSCSISFDRTVDQTTKLLHIRIE